MHHWPLVLHALLSAAHPDSTPPPRTDSLGPRIVRRFPAVEVNVARVTDLDSPITRHGVGRAELESLPLTSLAQAIALQPGVVAVGEDLHVRGGRAGETQVTVAGLALNEPLRDRAPEIPLLAVARADLLAGGMGAEHAGALAGVLEVTTRDPSPRPEGALRWMSSGRVGTAYDALGGRGSLPLPGTGLGLVAAGEARLDDRFLPARPSRGRESSPVGRIGWRNDNRLLAWAKLAPVGRPRAASLEAFYQRAIEQPFDPMFTVDDSFSIRTVTPGPGDFDPPTIDSLRVFYRAADHQPLSESRRWTLVARATSNAGALRWNAAASWQHATELVSRGLSRTAPELLDPQKLVFGEAIDPARDPFHAYGGEWDWFRSTRTDRVQASADGDFAPAREHRVGIGAGASWDAVDFAERDGVLPAFDGFDALRAFYTRAPGGWAWVRHRWRHEDLAWEGGLRLQMFDAGARAYTWAPGDGVTSAIVREHAAGPVWTLSPRLGIAFPLSLRDAVSMSYARIHQAPGREYLSDNRLLVYARRPLGSPTLEPGELLTYQAGLKHLFDARWSLQVSGFHRELYGQVGIVNDPYDAGTFRPRYANSEYGHATGVEVALLAGPAPVHAADRASWRHPVPGEYSLRYTFMNAYGTISGPDGWAYGPTIGARPLPTGEHPLDWDRGHMLGFDAVWRGADAWSLAWVTQVASGARWTPTVAYTGAASGPLLTPDLTAVDSRRLPWSERTDVSLRLGVPGARAVRVMVEVRNLFDERGDAAVSVTGFPNPVINSLRDDYAGYRTDTGRGGGAYWDPKANGGAGGWVPVHDPRLAVAPRSVRVGFELGR